MKQRRALLVVAALVAIPVAAGAALARLSLWPSGDAMQAPEPEIAGAQTGAPTVLASLDAAPSFAPALRLRTYMPAPVAAPAPIAPDPAPSEVSAAAVEPNTTVVSIDAPSPPVRPSALMLMGEAPFPPARPDELAARVVVASLSPQAPAPEIKPPLVEPQPMPAPAQSVAEQAPAADVPFARGQNAFVRIFKKEGELELWLKRGDRYALFKTYQVCKWSGHLGPKMREGDYQSPEGFYSVSAKQLHPKSKYHRAFNVGFPNALDKQLGYTGGALMVHGDCQSVGCFAMTDRGIDEIYGYVAAAIGAGQHEVPVHIFPFRMTNSNLASETGQGLLAFASSGNEQYASFWRNLKEGYDLFDRTGEPPTAYACNGRYAFNASAACKRIAGW